MHRNGVHITFTLTYSHLAFAHGCSIENEQLQQQQMIKQFELKNNDKKIKKEKFNTLL